MVRHMAHLVARGFTQIEGINLNETFSLVAWIESIWVVLVVVAIQDLEVYQMDVEIIFPNGDLSKEIYIQQLEGLWSRVLGIN